MNLFAQVLQQVTGAPQLTALSLQTLQINVGLRCNLECRHCHLAAGPGRREEMSWQTMERIWSLVEQWGIQRVDLTGGAPELHPRFREFVTGLVERQVQVQVRTNLSVLHLPEMRGMAEFFRHHRLQLVGSLPCYLEANVDAQRGDGSHQQMVAAIGVLNQLGYGREEGLQLDLVYNPGGAALPPNQVQLEAAYRRELAERYGLSFSRLLTITNMPIGRFRATLRQQGKEGHYWQVLQEAFNPATLQGLMCRHQLSMAWDGRFYDCDFNVALDLPLQASLEESASSLARRTIRTGSHCLACTAGSGSSCGGALAA
ncbi:MAG: radical SAM/Cys-rich domain protein [Magnetococcales bacterium]|nr:arsenosugar biosynthesis radical SAM protein ArsS [Magnetococcales bacterium]NGZ26042.1 radical SAM/Cys-rich domain protein [Magnetococcales bacterium]